MSLSTEAVLPEAFQSISGKLINSYGKLNEFIKVNQT